MNVSLMLLFRGNFLIRERTITDRVSIGQGLGVRGQGLGSVPRRGLLAVDPCLLYLPIKQKRRSKQYTMLFIKSSDRPTWWRDIGFTVFFLADRTDIKSLSRQAVVHGVPAKLSLQIILVRTGGRDEKGSLFDTDSF